MRRNLAILLVVIGTTLFGLACGYVYMDLRQMRLYEIEHSDNSQPPDPRNVARAMVLGPLGAGMALAGLVMVVLELPWFRREAGRRDQA